LGIINLEKRLLSNCYNDVEVTDFEKIS
jgi:hypothetical protein